jgi:hypothetical protein
MMTRTSRIGAGLLHRVLEIEVHLAVQAFSLSGRLSWIVQMRSATSYSTVS